ELPRPQVEAPDVAAVEREQRTQARVGERPGYQLSRRGVFGQPEPEAYPLPVSPGLRAWPASPVRSGRGGGGEIGGRQGLHLLLVAAQGGPEGAVGAEHVVVPVVVEVAAGALVVDPLALVHELEA